MIAFKEGHFCAFSNKFRVKVGHMCAPVLTRGLSLKHLRRVPSLKHLNPRIPLRSLFGSVR